MPESPASRKRAPRPAHASANAERNAATDAVTSDLVADPHEVNNLAGSPGYRHILEELRGRLQRWIEETDDQGRFPERPEAALL